MHTNSDIYSGDAGRYTRKGRLSCRSTKGLTFRAVSGLFRRRRRRGEALEKTCSELCKHRSGGRRDIQRSTNPVSTHALHGLFSAGPRRFWSPCLDQKNYVKEREDVKSLRPRSRSKCNSPQARQKESGSLQQHNNSKSTLHNKNIG